MLIPRKCVTLHYMDNSDIILDGFDPDSLDNLSVPLRRPSKARLRPEADTYTTTMQDPGNAEDYEEQADISVPAQCENSSVQSPRTRRRRVAAADVQPSPSPQEQAHSTVSDHVARIADRATHAADRAGEVAGRVLDSMDFSVPTGWISDGRLSKMFGCVLVMVALYLLIVAISFFSTGAADQSLVMALQKSGMAMPGMTVDPANAGGISGALLSYNLIARSLGVGAFAVIYWVAALGLAFMRVYRFNLFSLTAKSFMSAIALSVIAGYISMHFVSTFHWGGFHGLYINELIHTYAGEIGTLLFSVLLLLIIGVVFMQDITRGIRVCVAGYRNLRSAVTVENRRRRAREVAEAREAAAHRQAMEQAAATVSDTSVPSPIAKPETGPVASPVKTNSHISGAESAQAPRPVVRHDVPIVIDRDIAEVYAPATAIDRPVYTDPVRTTVNSPVMDDPEEMEDFDIDDTITDDLCDEPSVMEQVYVPAAVSDPDSKPESDVSPYNRIETNVSLPSEQAAPDPESVIPVTPASAAPVSEVATDITEKPCHTVTPVHEKVTDHKNDIPVSTPETVVRTEPEIIVRTAPEIKEASYVATQPYDPTAELSHYRFPSLDLLHERETRKHTIDLEEQDENKRRLVATLGSFGIAIDQIEATIGPTVTLYEIVPSEGVRVARIKALENDLARAIAAIGTRISQIPGRETVGIEVPNKDPQIVPIRSVLASEDFQNCDMQLPMAMGVTIDNKVYMADLCKMPHLLVAGATGMGKSVGLNTIITSLLYKKHPAELKFVLVDPKMVEFSLYRRLEKHYLAKLPDQEDAIITDPMQVVPTLNSLCLEMDNRYMLLKEAYVRNILEYNAKFSQRRLNPDKGHRYLPYIVVIVDEFADLIMTAGKEVEQPIARIAQKARAVGIHLILATQRPSTNVITGIIKANFPGRIAFRVFQMVDSRTILDRPGANQLIGRGDMLFSRDGIVDRVQCAFIDTDEVDAICECISDQQGYSGPYELPEIVPENTQGGQGRGAVADIDPFFADAGRYVTDSGLGSTSAIQRHFNIGYPRAGKIMDQLEQAGVVGPVVGAKPRTVLMDRFAFESYLETLNQ